MTTYAVLLHAVNVGGRNRVPMAEFRALLSGLGYTEVATVLNSGNAVIAGAESDPAVVVRRVHTALADALGLDVTVQVRTTEQLATVLAANPFPDATADPSHLLVTFLDTTPPQDALDPVDLTRFPDEEVALIGDTLYIWYRAGVGRSALSLGPFARFVRTHGTARNWTTVGRLHTLAADRQR